MVISVTRSYYAPLRQLAILILIEAPLPGASIRIGRELLFKSNTVKKLDCIQIILQIEPP